MALAIIAAAIYLPALGHGFIETYDDDLYVTGNDIVQEGITADGLDWAFRTGFASNWHPLTWLSHMADVTFFGLDPWGHHLVSILFHAANTALLFYALYLMTGRQWPSALVAALFAIHPLHVESVAWIAERKDVLSAFFWLLSLIAYVRYVRKPLLAAYAAVLISFALGLMAKPMVVTLPCVLLLLDFWPLRRFSLDGPNLLSRVAPYVVEKLPLFALAAGSAIITIYVQGQGGAVTSIESLPLSVRAANACLAYGAYLKLTLVPAGLAAYYPHPAEAINVAAAMAAGIGLIIATMVVIALRNRAPYLLTGWLWFIGVLVPVIGIVQVGNQAYADRYTYIPHMGLFIAVAWSFAAIAERRYFRPVVVAVSAILVVTYSGVTNHVIGFWADSETLFVRAIAVTEDNFLAHNNLGNAYMAQGRVDEAIDQFETAIEVQPNYADAYYNLARAYEQRQRIDEAVQAYETALSLKPDDADTLINYAMIMADRGALHNAADMLQRAIALAPSASNAYLNLGVVYSKLGEPNDALAAYIAGLDHAPRNARLHNNLANLLARYGEGEQLDKALRHFDQAISLEPDYLDARFNRIVLLDSMGRTEEARQALDQLRRSSPDYAPAQDYRAGPASP